MERRYVAAVVLGVLMFVLVISILVGVMFLASIGLKP